MISIKEMVENKSVKFQYFREGELWYATEDGFKFPVPIADVGTGVFNAEDRAILFMRWIRKQREAIDSQHFTNHGCEV